MVLFHYHLTWPYDDVAVTGLFQRARLGVDAFFILSGFILTHVYDPEWVEGRFHYRRFILARVARIFPLHLAAVALVVVMVTAARVMGADFDPRGYDLPALLMTLVLVQAWFPTDQTTLWNGPSWSLSAEWFAYLLFPVFARVGLWLRRRPAALVGLAVTVFLLFDWISRAQFGRILPHAEHSVGIMRIVPEFLFGVALYRLGQGLHFGPRATLGAAAAATAMVVSLMHVHADDRLIVAAMGPWLLTLALLSKSGVAGWLAARPLTFLGEVSFALYLVHIPLLILWKNAVAELTGSPASTS